MQSYLDLMQDVLTNGEGHDDRTGVGTRSVFGRQWRHDMRTGFPLLTTKKVPLRWVFEELMWFLRGQTDEKILSDQGITIWQEWATKEKTAKFGREEGDLGHVYGALWRNFLNYQGDNLQAFNALNPGNDQIATLLQDIKHNPGSRRLIITGWHPVEARRVELPPCHTLTTFKCHVEAREMSLHLKCRSIDTFLGLPFNIASYALLLQLVGYATGYAPRELIITFDDLHIYSNHMEAVREQLSRKPFPMPKVAIAARRRETALETLLGVTWQDIDLTRYRHHTAIKAPVAV